MIKFTRIQKIMLGIIACLLAFTILTNGKGSTIKGLVYDPVVMLKYSIFEYPVQTVKNWMEDLDNLWAVYEENKWLRQELSKVDQKDALIESYQKEIAELKGLMGQTVDKKFLKKYATIINRNPETYSNQITLNIGTKDGVSLDNAVISNSGLIGKIIEVNEDTSRVRLLTSQDQLSKVSVQIHVNENESIQGYLEQYDFKKGAFVVRLFTNTDVVKVDQNVTTSGVGGVFPNGLFVGKVFMIDELLNENGRILYVTPAADFSSFQYVAVMCEVQE